MFDDEQKPLTETGEAIQDAEPLTDGELSEDQEWQRLEEKAAGISGEVIPASQAESPEFTTADMVEMILGPGFELLAPNWQVTPQEVKTLSGAYGKALDLWLPGFDVSPKYAALIGAMGSTYMLIQSRKGTPAKEQPKEDEQSEQGEAEPLSDAEYFMQNYHQAQMQGGQP